MKECSQCHNSKPAETFRHHSAICPACISINKAKWRRDNPEKVKAQKKRSWERHRDRICAAARNLTEAERLERNAKHRDYLARNRDIVNAKRRARLRNPKSAAYQFRFGSGREAYLDQKRRHNATARPKQGAYRRKKWLTDPNFRLKHALSRFARDAVFEGSKSKAAAELLGCSVESFKIYLESKFESGMTWENYGVRGWQIDHIMPKAIFDLTKPEHRKRCFHYSNMQPLWAKENRAKSNKVLDPQFPLI